MESVRTLGEVDPSGSRHGSPRGGLGVGKEDPQKVFLPEDKRRPKGPKEVHDEESKSR